MWGERRVEGRRFLRGGGGGGGGAEEGGVALVEAESPRLQLLRAKKKVDFMQSWWASLAAPDRNAICQGMAFALSRESERRREVAADALKHVQSVGEGGRPAEAQVRIHETG